MSAAAGRRTLDSQLQAGLQRLSSRLIYPGRSLTYQALRSGVLQQQLPWVEVVCQLVTLDDRLSCSTLARDEEVVRALAQFAWAHAPQVFPVDSNQGQAHASSGNDLPQDPVPAAAAAAAPAAAAPPGCTADAAADPAAARSARSNVTATAATAAAAAAGSDEVPVGGVRRTRSSARQAAATSSSSAAAAAPPAPSGRAAKRRAVATSTTAAAAAAPVLPAAPPAAAAAALPAGGVDQQQPLSGEALHAALLAGRREWQEASLEALSYDPAATILISQACAAGLHALVGLLGVSCCGCVLQQAVPYVLLRGLVLLAKNFAPTLFLQMVRYLTALSSPGLLQDQTLWCQLLSEAAAGQAHSATALRLVWGKAGGAALLLAGPAAVSQVGPWASSSSGGADGGVDGGAGGAGPSSSRSGGVGVANVGSGSSSAGPSSSGSSGQSRFAVELRGFFERSGGSVTSAAVAKALVAATPELFRWHGGQHPAAKGLVKALCSGAVYAAAAGDHKVCELLAAALAEILEAAPVPVPAAEAAAGGVGGPPAAAAAGGLGGPPAAAAAAVAAAGGGEAGAGFPVDAGYVAAALAAAEAHQAAAAEALVAAGAALAGPAAAAAAAGAAAGPGAAGVVAEADAAEAAAALNVVHDTMVQAQADAEAAIMALQAAQAAIGAAGLMPADLGQQEEAAGAGAGAEDPATAAVLAATANLQAASAAVQAAIGPLPAAELLAAVQAATAAVAATAAATAQTVATLTAPAVPPLPAAAAAPPAPAAAAAAAAGLIAAGQAAMEAVAAASARGGSSSSSSSPVPGALVELLLALLRQQDSLARAGVWTVLHRVVQAQHWGLLVGQLLGPSQGSSMGGQLQQLLDGLAASFDSVGGYSYVQVSTLQRLLLQDLGAGQAAVQHAGLMSAAMQQLGSSPWLWYGAAPGIVQLMTQGAGPAAVASCPRVLTQLLNQQVLNDGQVQEVWEGLLGNETFMAGLLAGVAAAEEAWLRLLWREDLVEVTNVATAHPGLPQALAEACSVAMGPLESLDDLLMFLMTSDPGQAYLDTHPVLLAAVAARLGKGGCYALPVWYMGNLWFNDEGPGWLLRHPVLLEAVARALVNNQGHWDSEAVAMELSTRAAFQEVVLGSAEILDQLIKVLGSKARGTLSVTQQLVQPCVTILQGLAAAEATLILEQRAAAAEAGGAAGADAAGGGGAVGGDAAAAAAAEAAAALAAAQVMADFGLGPPAAAAAAAGGEDAAQQVMAAAMAADAAMAGMPPQLAAAAVVGGGGFVGPPPPPAAAAAAGGAAAAPAAVPQQALRPPVVELVLQRAASEDPDIQAGVWEAMSVLHRVLLANIRLQLLTPLQRFAAAGQEVQQCQASLGALQASKRAVELEREHSELDTAMAQLATSRMLMQQQQEQEDGQGGTQAGGVGSSSRGAAGGNSQGGMPHTGQQQLEGRPGEDLELAGANSSAAAALAAAGPSSRQRKRRMGTATVEEEGEPSKRTRGQRRR